MTAALFLWIHTHEQAFEQVKLEQRAQAHMAALRYELQDLAHEVTLVNCVLVALAPVSQGEFDAFAAPLLQRFPYIQGLRTDAVNAETKTLSPPAAKGQSGFSVAIPLLHALQAEPTLGHTNVDIDAAALVSRALLTASLLDTLEFDIHLYTGVSADDAQLVYRLARASSVDNEDSWIPAFLQQRITQSSSFDAAGMLWHVVVSSHPVSIFHGTHMSLLTLLGGLLLSFAAAYWMHTQVAHLRRIQFEVDERNTQLELINERLVYDISARKQAEEDLRQAQQVLTVAQKLGHLGSWELDAVSGKLRVSDELFRIFGLEPQCRQLTLDDVLGMIHPDDRDAARRAMAGTRNEGKNFRMESRALRPDGSVRYMISVSEATHDDNARLVRVAGSVLDITEHKETELALRRSQQELRELAAHQERIREDERKRIAREVHDALGSLLTGIKAYLSVSMERNTSAGMPVDRLVAEASGLVDRASETVRELITDLRPSVLDQLGIWEALRWYAEQIERRTQLTCECVIEAHAAATEVDAERGVVIFRIVQESLTNVLRHAHATYVTIRAVRQGDAILIEVEDNGVGCDTDLLRKAKSWGIVGMHERARYFGGEFDITGTPGKGTIAALRLPMNDHTKGYE